MNKILFWLLQLTWGIIMTVIGAFAFLVTRFKRGKETRVLGGAVITIIPGNWGGICLGPFLFMASEYHIPHEYGHAIQNAFFGILFPFIIGIPSIVRAGWRKHQVKKGVKLTTDYYDIWFEKQANEIGSYFLLKEDFK